MKLLDGIKKADTHRGKANGKSHWRQLRGQARGITSQKKGRSSGESELKRRLELTDSKSGGLLGMLVHIHYGETRPLQQTWLNGKTQFSP